MVIASMPFVSFIPNDGEEFIVWMLRFAQHDKVEDSKPHPLVPLLQQGEGCFGESQNRVRSRGHCKHAFCVISNDGEESSAMRMLR